LPWQEDDLGIGVFDSVSRKSKALDDAIGSTLATRAFNWLDAARPRTTMDKYRAR
jgi:hypothetical protein